MGLAETLAPPARLALAYAPRAARPAWLAFLALDARLAGVVRQAREPLIGQIRLAWWRERLGEPAAAWPAGEPLLLLLREWGDHRRGLGAMVDGWEVLLAEPPLPPDSVEAAISGRAAGAAAVAQHLGQEQHTAEVERLARAWSAADFAAGISDEAEAAAFREHASARRAASLPRALRPLVVLEALARSTRPGPLRLAAAVRLGIFGR
jgi:phytoene synthase